MRLVVSYVFFAGCFIVRCLGGRRRFERNCQGFAGFCCGGRFHWHMGGIVSSGTEFVCRSDAELLGGQNLHYWSVKH